MAKPVIIYASGLLSTGYLHSLSIKARMFFLRRGYEFRVVHAKPAGSIEERARELYALIAINKPKRIHLVSHSMGGLSARYVACNLNRNDIVSVTTISTPHHGSIFADKYVKDPVLKPDDNDFEQAYKQLTSAHMSEWNKTCPDNPNVKYFSMGFEGDDMVTPSSALWGKSLGVGHCSHLMQTSPWFGGQFSKTFQIVLNNLDSL